MLDLNKIYEIAEREFEGTDKFVVEADLDSADGIEVLIDSDSSVGIDDCVRLSRALHEAFGEEIDDHGLTVASAGIGRPLKLLRQYKKLIGHDVEVVMNSGVKITGLLEDAHEDTITVTYRDRVPREDGRKGKKTVDKTETISLGDIKSTVEHIRI